MTLVQKEVKKVRKGTTLVRPVQQQQEFYYHLVNDWGSVAQLEADWWTFYRESWSATSWREFGANGMRNTNSWSGTRVAWIVLSNPLNISSATKITLECNTYIVSGSWNGASNAALVSSNERNPARAWWRFNSSNNSGANGYSLYMWSSGVDNLTSLSTWNYTVTAVFDLSNKTALMTVTWMSNLTWTLSDSDVTNIRTAPYIQILFDNTWVYYKDIKLTVE